jgi:DNA modification methylase
VSVYYQDDAVTLYHGDCLDVMRTLPDASVDAVVTDPPYGLGFMGREWDSFASERKDGSRGGSGDKGILPGYGRGGTSEDRVKFRDSESRAFGAWCEGWTAEAFRVLKPGGHLLAFGGTRTWHRLAVAVEDAGFEIRDSVAWIYGQGFPKSLNVSNDKAFCQCSPVESECGTEARVEGMERRRATNPVRSVRNDRATVAESGTATSESVLLLQLPIDGQLGDVGGEQVRRDRNQEDATLRRSESGVEGRRDSQAGEGQLQGRSLHPLPSGVSADGAVGRLHHGAPVSDGSVGRPLSDKDGSRQSQGPRPVEQHPTEPGTVPVERGSQAGRGWPVCDGCGKPRVTRGLGTSLKPAFEPVVVGRKPLVGTVAQNVITHGVGALNIDACRVEGIDPANAKRLGQNYGETSSDTFGQVKAAIVGGNLAGRWPANVVLDDTQTAELDKQSGTTRSQSGGSAGWQDQYVGGTYTPIDRTGYDDGGGASRFFPTFRYEAKAASSERPRGDDGTAHPTVKPLDLMRWLVRLVTPPGGTVLEPFAGSGTTLEACIIEGFDCIGIERDAQYLPLIEARLSKPIQPDLFGSAS